jgi:HlyD family secretion protein
MKKRLIWIAVLAAAACLLGFSVYRRIASRAASGQKPVAVPVAAAFPERGTVERSLAYPGTLEPKATVTVISKVAGRVESILVKEGRRVEEGALLVKMEEDAPKLQADQAAAAVRAAEAQLDKARRGVRPEELQNAKASLAQAEKELQTAKDDFGRAESLHKAGTISTSAFEEADTRLKAAQTELDNATRSVRMMEQGAGSEEQQMAEAQLSAAKAAYSLAKLQLDNTRIYSPIAGQVAKVLIDEGNLASTATPLLVVVNEAAMTLKVAMPEKYYGDMLVRGNAVRARARFDALPGRGWLECRVVSISPTIDPASRTFTAELEVKDPSGELRAGMYASVSITIARAENALRIPAAAVVTRGDSRGVFVVEGDPPAARFKEIETGIDGGEFLEVLDGVTEKDRVVEEGGTFLEDGQPVNPGE